MDAGNPQKRFCSHEMLRLTAEGYDVRIFAQISISLFYSQNVVGFRSKKRKCMLGKGGLREITAL